MKQRNKLFAGLSLAVAGAAIGAGAIVSANAMAASGEEAPADVLTMISVSSDGAYSVNAVPLVGQSPDILANAMLAAAKSGKDSVVVIQADASAKHQAVITVMEAARRAGLAQITFATQPSGKAATR